MLVSRMPSGAPEIFATVQGEGASCGVPSVFVRLADCNLQCTWCFVPDTPILMWNWSWKALGDLVVGDRVLAMRRPDGRYRHRQLAEATVTRTQRRRAATVVVNDDVRCTPDHQFWLTGKDEAGKSAVHSGWREVNRATGLRVMFTAAPVARDRGTYERGWLAGMADGDGCFWTLKHRRGYRRFRLALKDEELLERAEDYASRAGFVLRRGRHKHLGFSGTEPGEMSCLWLTADAQARAFESWLAIDSDDMSWSAGYVGGMLDAEGSLSQNVMRVSQDAVVNEKTCARIARALDVLGLRYTAERKGFYIWRSNGDAWRVLSSTTPAKVRLLRSALEHAPQNSKVIRTVYPTGNVEEVVTLSTDAGSFIAGGYVVKNCDTAYTWDWSRFERKIETVHLSVDEIASATLSSASGRVRNVVFTGGEPLLQQKDLALVARRLRDDGLRIEVETNGTVRPEPALAESVDQWNVSPKLAGSGNALKTRFRPTALEWFAQQSTAYFKFVLSTPEDLEEVESVVSGLGVPSERVILMPEGTTPEDLAARSQWLAELCTEHGYRLGARLHVHIWGSERGR